MDKKKLIKKIITLIVLSLYLGVSFAFDIWAYSWIIWVIYAIYRFIVD